MLSPFGLVPVGTFGKINVKETYEHDRHHSIIEGYNKKLSSGYFDVGDFIYQLQIA